MPAPAQTESKLPMAQQQRRERIIAENADNTDITPNPDATPSPVVASVPAPSQPAPSQPTAVQPAPAPAPAPTPAPAPPDANADILARLEAAEQRAQLLALQLAEAQNPPAPPLTAPGTGSNADPSSPPAPSGFGFAQAFDEAQGATLTDEESADYSDAETAIRKFAGQEAVKLMRKPLEDIVARLGTLENQLHNTTNTVQRSASEGFVGIVKTKVPDFDAIVVKPEWQTFLQGTVPLSGGLKFQDALRNAHNSRNLDEIIGIFDKYRGGTAEPGPNTSGYASVAPNGGAATPPAVHTGEEKLPFSVRKQASEDFLKGRITREDMDRISKQYNDAADKGQIDYSK